MRYARLMLMILCAGLVNCASAAASRPTIASTLPYEDILAVQFNDRDGVFIEMDAFKDMLAGHAQEMGELRNEVATATVGKAMSDATAKAYKHAAEQQIWRATWGPVIGGVSGFTLGVGGTIAGEAMLSAIRR